jgi:hypothetical protein
MYIIIDNFGKSLDSAAQWMLYMVDEVPGDHLDTSSNLHIELNFEHQGFIP